MIVRGDKVRMTWSAIIVGFLFYFQSLKDLKDREFTVEVILDDICHLRYQEFTYSAPTRILKKVS